VNPLEALRGLVSPHANRWRANRRFEEACREFAIRGITPPVLYDIGARWGVSEPYGRLKSIPGFRSVGFEPDAEEAARLSAARHFDIVCPVALGDRHERRKLHIARDPGSSTLFPPDMQEIARHSASTQFETVGETEVEVQPLDDVIRDQNLPAPDFIKVDCEGAEGIIFSGATDTLKSVIGITFEARMVEFYKGGATLGPLLEFFFKKGFVCLRMNPVGAFFDTLMMFDVVMIRHPESCNCERENFLGALFSLLHGSWLYAKRFEEITKGRRNFFSVKVES